MMLGDQALVRFIAEPWEYAYDIGSGSGLHSKVMKDNGKTVATIDIGHAADYVGDYNYMELEKVDAIWCCHVLEHQTNPGSFLRKIFHDLNPDGLLAVTVPPLKHEIVGGHVSLWNAGLLLYNLIMAGFDCSEARVGVYGYNISVLVRKKEADLKGLVYDYGDIQTLSDYFPFKAEHGFDGRLGNINW